MGKDRSYQKKVDQRNRTPTDPASSSALPCLEVSMASSARKIFLSPPTRSYTYPELSPKGHALWPSHAFILRVHNRRTSFLAPGMAIRHLLMDKMTPPRLSINVQALLQPVTCQALASGNLQIFQHLKDHEGSPPPSSPLPQGPLQLQKSPPHK